MKLLGLLLVIVVCCGYTMAAPATLVRKRRVSGSEDGESSEDNLFDYKYEEGDERLYEDYEEYQYGETFLCSDEGEEVAVELMCDGFIDCADGSDEIVANCEEHGITPTTTTSPSPTVPATTKTVATVTSKVVQPLIREIKSYEYDYVDACIGEEFQCTSDISICLLKSQVCDGVNDCPHKEDEAACGDRKVDSELADLNHTTAEARRIEVVNVTMDENFCLSLDAFQCRSRPDDCVPKELLCDGYGDCLDGSDEERCSCGVGKYSCVNGQCVEASSRCDGISDCGDFSDEILGCVMSLRKVDAVSGRLRVPSTQPALQTTEIVKTSQSTEVNPTNFTSRTSVVTSNVVAKQKKGICSFHPCANHGKCLENGASFVCVCKSGYTGPTCIQKEDSSQNSAMLSTGYSALNIVLFLIFLSLL